MSRGKFWVTEPDQEVEVRVADSGYGARPPVTLIEVMKKTIKEHPTAKALASQTKVDVSDLFFLMETHPAYKAIMTRSP